MGKSNGNIKILSVDLTSSRAEIMELCVG